MWVFSSGGRMILMPRDAPAVRLRSAAASSIPIWLRINRFQAAAHHGLRRLRRSSMLCLRLLT